MTYTLTYLNDVVAANGALSLGDNGAHRIVYVHQGSATVNGTEVPADEAAYAKGALEIEAGAEGARIFRWDLVKGAYEKPMNVETMVRMSRDVWSIDIEEGSQWLYRLDRINHSAPEPADCHTHPGPGIRALLSGVFVIQQTSENGGGEEPGDPWWETGPETVISTPMSPGGVQFLRGMILPVEYEGRPDTADWKRTFPTEKSEWKLYVDETVTL